MQLEHLWQPQPWDRTELLGGINQLRAATRQIAGGIAELAAAATGIGDAMGAAAADAFVQT